MTMLDKIKAFFKRPKPEAKGAEKKPDEIAKKKEVSGETQKRVRNDVVN